MPEQGKDIPGPENSSWKAQRCESAEQVAERGAGGCGCSAEFSGSTVGRGSSSFPTCSEAGRKNPALARSLRPPLPKFQAFDESGDVAGRTERSDSQSFETQKAPDLKSRLAQRGLEERWK